MKIRILNNIIGIFGISIILLMACNKSTDVAKIENQDFESKIKVVNLQYEDKQLIQMLEFSTTELFDQTAANLLSQMEANDDDFVNTYSTLNEEQLNAKEDEIGFNYQQPLIDFENLYGYESSMRQVFNVAEQNWLNTEELDPSTNPCNIYGFDLIEMTLLNTEGEVKIGDKILKLTKNGFIYILDGSLSTLIRIREGDMTVLDDSNVITNIDGLKSGDCKGWKSQSIPHTYVYNSKKVYKYMHFHSYPWKGSSLVKLSSYKKSGTSWKKYRMMLGVKNMSYYRDSNCNSAGAENSGWVHKNRKELSQYTHKNGAFPQFRAENGASVWGMYQYAGISINEVLTW